MRKNCTILYLLILFKLVYTIIRKGVIDVKNLKPRRFETDRVYKI